MRRPPTSVRRLNFPLPLPLAVVIRKELLGVAQLGVDEEVAWEAVVVVGGGGGEGVGGEGRGAVRLLVVVVVVVVVGLVGVLGLLLLLRVVVLLLGLGMGLERLLLVRVLGLLLDLLLLAGRIVETLHRAPLGILLGLRLRPLERLLLLGLLGRRRTLERNLSVPLPLSPLLRSKKARLTSLSLLHHFVSRISQRRLAARHWAGAAVRGPPRGKQRVLPGGDLGSRRGSNCRRGRDGGSDWLSSTGRGLGPGLLLLVLRVGALVLVLIHHDLLAPLAGGSSRLGRGALTGGRGALGGGGGSGGRVVGATGGDGSTHVLRGLSRSTKLILEAIRGGEAQVLVDNCKR